MIIIFLSITFNTILVSGSSLSDQVYQTPADMYNKPGETAKLNCSHSIQNYNRILWYKQSKNRQMQLLGYMLRNNGYPETGMSVKMDGSANKDETSTLTIEGLRLNSSAVYFCAANSGEYFAYFGQGTKLTVLEPNIDVTPPTVKILQPSLKDCKDKKDKTGKKNKRTLVCVASGFYPDHVSVLWKIEAENVTDGVATDNAALRDGEKYSITSRLRVPARTWHTPGMKFTCIVSFFNGNDTIDHSDSVYGTELGQGEGMTREKYLKITQTAKLSYGVFIAKSSLYGVFVLVLVWKLQASSGKQSN
ncbi:M1-specific T cell receptor beta chain-like [Centroberyx affinis]|uniref:M1-specific T cell receptor beta chain-like n=1 Tax=Centroberyx affinis TaxID=166261 RepID=UPI003A5C5B5C